MTTAQNGTYTTDATIVGTGKDFREEICSECFTPTQGGCTCGIYEYAMEQK